jgi:hypothetical protein
MKCHYHNNDATVICPSCGKGLCSECSIISDTTRNACSKECMRNLKTLDEAATLGTTKAKNSLKANVIFCRFLGAAFIFAGVLFSIVFGKPFISVTAFTIFMGVAFFIGAQFYASAIKEK